MSDIVTWLHYRASEYAKVQPKSEANAAIAGEFKFRAMRLREAADEIERLQRLLNGRDDFLVSIGQFQAFVDQLPKNPQ